MDVETKNSTENCLVRKIEAIAWECGPVLSAESRSGGKMKNILDEEIKYNILIYTKPEIVEHKMRDVIDKKNSQLELGVDDDDWDSGFCYWTVGRPPTRDGIGKVLFTDGTNIFAEGKFFGTAIKSIEFDALKRVKYPQPKKAPTRGYTYVTV